jgi:hypothetical protein
MCVSVMRRFDQIVDACSYFVWEPPPPHCLRSMGSAGNFQWSCLERDEGSQKLTCGVISSRPPYTKGRDNNVPDLVLHRFCLLATMTTCAHSGGIDPVAQTGIQRAILMPSYAYCSPIAPPNAGLFSAERPPSGRGE